MSTVEVKSAKSAPVVAPVAVPVPGTPGYKTSEFWLNLLAVLLTAFLASGVVTETSNAVKVVGYVLSVLAALGYTAARTSLKR